ncbi:UNVERIFIED_CONTAM: hypothetical protein HDU68_007232 [Siphonaria sp. JEL0065]|nr:hypothetical protein HDU68_007232 [Siphonaria sp. JEL0065]
MGNNQSQSGEGVSRRASTASQSQSPSQSHSQTGRVSMSSGNGRDRDAREREREGAGTGTATSQPIAIQRVTNSNNANASSSPSSSSSIRNNSPDVNVTKSRAFATATNQRVAAHLTAAPLLASSAPTHTASTWGSHFHQQQQQQQQPSDKQPLAGLFAKIALSSSSSHSKDNPLASIPSAPSPRPPSPDKAAAAVVHTEEQLAAIQKELSTKPYLNSAKIVHNYGVGGIAPLQPLEKKKDDKPVIPVMVSWTGGGRVVHITGTFNNWKQKIRLTKSKTDFSTVIDMPAGDTHRFKFIVDDEWKCSEDLPIASDSEGNLVNYLEVVDEFGDAIHDGFDGLAHDDEVQSPLGESPESSYTSKIPQYLSWHLENQNAAAVAAGNPPLSSSHGHSPSSRKSTPPPLPTDPPPHLPPHLEKVFLNAPVPITTHRDDNLILPVPSSVTLNHLYACSIKDGVMALSSTTRYKQKMSTNEKPKLATFNGFHVLPVTMGAAASTAVQHSILFKPHNNPKADEAEQEQFPNDHTLFLCNLPIDTSKNHILRLFRRCGPIAAIHLDVSKKHRHAHIVFEDKDAIVRCIEMRQRKRVWSDLLEEGGESGDQQQDEPQPRGLEKWVKEFIANHPPLKALQESADRYMKQYDDMHNEKQRELARRRAEPDEDGFILVGAHKQVKKVDPMDQDKNKEGGDGKKMKKKLERVDFYRFQMRESKRNQLVELRNKFEEDKKRIEKLKATRKFKPY